MQHGATLRPNWTCSARPRLAAAAATAAAAAVVAAAAATAAALSVIGPTWCQSARLRPSRCRSGSVLIRRVSGLRSVLFGLGPPSSDPMVRLRAIPQRVPLRPTRARTTRPRPSCVGPAPCWSVAKFPAGPLSETFISKCPHHALLKRYVVASKRRRHNLSLSVGRRRGFGNGPPFTSSSPGVGPLLHSA